MKTTITKTLKTFDVTYFEDELEYVSHTWYLDELSNGEYLISRDESPMSRHENKELAEKRFNELAKQKNCQIEVCK